MDSGIVQALGQQLGAVHLAAALDVGGIASAKGNVAGGIFIKQGVIEQHAALVDGARCRNQGDFANAAGILVGGKQLSQQAGVLLRAMLNNFAVLEGHMPALNQLAVVHIGLGAVHNAVYPLTVGCAEHFLGGHIGDKVGAVFRLAGSPLPGGIICQANGQVGAVGAGHVDMVQVPGVQLVAVAAAFGHMGFPGADRVAGGNAADIKDECPQLFHRFLHRDAGEHFCGPGRCRNSGHTPLYTVVHRVFLPGFQEFAAGQVDAVDLGGIQPGQCFGVSGVDCQGAAAIRVLSIVQVAAQLIGLHGSQVFLFGILIMQAAEFVILPTHDAVFSTGFIPGFDAGMAELRHGDRAADDKILARLNIDTDFDDKIGIQLKIMLVHKAFSFLLARLWIFKHACFVFCAQYTASSRF